jgi:hypothetical protein
VKYSTWVLFSVLPVIFLVHHAAGPQKARRAALAVCGLALLMILPLGIALQEVIMAQIGLLIDYQRPGLARWSESFVSTFFFQTHPLAPIAALVGLGIGLRHKDRKILIPAYLVILLVVILQVKRIRYLLPIFPMLAMVAAYGLRRLPSPRLRKFLVLSALGGALTLALGGFLPFTKQLSIVNIQAGGRFLDTLAAADIAVYTPPQRANQANLALNIPLLDLFTDKRVYSLTPSAERPSPAMDLTSAFRFTWDQKLPDFYQPPSDGPGKPAALVVISSGPPHLAPAVRARVAQYRRVQAFTQKTGLFSYTTFVTIYYD